MQTKGDQWLESSLSKVGGKGLFVKELEAALLNNEADIAVHSMKDVPADFPASLGLPVILERHDPRDALLGVKAVADLPHGACVGTASQRRQLQVIHQRPDLKIKLLRGNIQTRMRKLDEGQYDAILLAASGLKRMQYDHRIDHILEPEEMLPSIGQGALGVECRLDDQRTRDLIAPLDHPISALRVRTERAVGHCMGSSCQTPVAAYAQVDGDEVYLRALMGDPHSGEMLREEGRTSRQDAEALGQKLGYSLLQSGGQAILDRLQAQA